MNAYDELFVAYLTDMRTSMTAARAWWEALAKKERAARGSKAKAEEALSRRWPFGAASHPYVLATYRKYYLACERLNERLENAEDDGSSIDFINESMWGQEVEEAEVSDDPRALADLDVEGPVEPWGLLIEMLPGRADDVSEFLAGMVMSPIGMDENERSV